jgi:hypothetical protein
VRSVCWAVGLSAVLMGVGALVHLIPRRFPPQCYVTTTLDAPLCNFNNNDLDAVEWAAWAGAVVYLLAAVVALMWQLRRGSSVNDPGEEA